MERRGNLKTLLDRFVQVVADQQQPDPVRRHQVEDFVRRACRRAHSVSRSPP